MTGTCKIAGILLRYARAADGKAHYFGDAMRWTVVQVAEALGVAPPAGLDPMARLAGVSIDSRTVQPGELFLAIRGPRHDGHAFVAGALAGGAAAGVVARERFAEYPEEIRGRLFAVDDTLAALQRLASRACDIWRGGRKGRIIGAVAGSVGKTTTKEILAALVGARFRVLKTQGNLNNEYGLPLTLLGLDEEHDAAVVELGMSHRGELARLAKIASPEIGVVTRVAVEHLEFFSSIDEIALAERELIENLAGPDATAVLNADDERVARLRRWRAGASFAFGTSARAEFRAEAIEERGIEGSAFDFVLPGGRARLESAADWAAQCDECPGGACGGERLGHWRGGSEGRVPEARAGGQARRSGAI